MLPIRTILHPTDFSERAEDAFQTACSLARDHGAHLVVERALRPGDCHEESAGGGRQPWCRRPG